MAIAVHIHASASIIAIALAFPAVAQTHVVNIDPQPLPVAVRQLSDQAGVQVLAARKLTQGKTSKAISGDLTIPVAFDRLLAGTGLAAKATGPRTYVILPVSTASASSAALEVPQSDQDGQTGSSDAEIVVTGFRSSLNTALGIKRSQTAAIDAIAAEDIGKFPDSNLAESMQRVPGVALARGDGGEGRQISVRGLGPAFTRVRINGLEAASRTGSSDVYGAGTSGRSFDFNSFPTEIFSRLTVQKTPSADTEDGSLGATVDLMAPKPLEQKGDFILAATLRGVYNDVATDATPRASILVSRKSADGRWGILGSVAYQERHLREVGYQGGNIVSGDTNGLFCSPVGFTPQNPGNSVLKGTDALNCSNGNPRTSTPAAYQTIYNAVRDDAPTRPGSGAFFPRTPRYMSATQEQQRIGGSLTLQFQPDDRTDISVDLLYSRFEVTRDDKFIEAISFARSASNNGQPMTSVRDIELTELGSLAYGVFDGVDIRSEGLYENFVSTFKQANLNFRHELTDSLTFSGLFGMNESSYLDRIRMQYQMDAIDTDNFVVDARGKIPTLDFGIDVSDVGNFAYGPALSDGTVLGGFSLQGRPSRYVSKVLTSQVDLDWKIHNSLSIKFGGQFRRTDYRARGTNYYTSDINTKALPAGITLASLTEMVDGTDGLWGRGSPTSWVSLDAMKFYESFALADARTCGVECGPAGSRVVEEVSSAYLMGKFDLEDMMGISVRGDVGVRYVHTGQQSSGYISVGASAGAPTPTGVVGQFNALTRSYDEWLPSANIVIEPIRNLLIRAAGAKVMARPDLGVLMPTSGVNPIIRTGSINNPLLDPIRANTFDLGLEWYFRPGSLLSAAFFYKDIKTYVQNISSLIAFQDLGLPNELLTGSNTAPTELFDISRPTNTKGGPLRGVEVNAQIPFDFISGFLGHFGLLGNYTRVTSKIDYILSSAGGVPTATVTADLVNLSKNTASGTLYYEDDRFSIRGTVNYRDPFIRQIPGNPGSDSYNTASTLFVDASASFALNDRIKVIVEGQNLTDEKIELYIDSRRKDTQQITRVGRTISAGLNFKF